ncbi:MAG: glucosyltransferase-I precursor [bacterium]|nr:glucosyltransferase-I precursor [bacterium]
MRLPCAVVLALAIAGCGLGDKFHGDAAVDQDMAIGGGGNDLAATDMAVGDMATPPNSDLAGADLSTPMGPAPQWTTIPSPVGSKFLNGAWGPSADSVFIVGEAGTILHSIDRGTTWSGGVGVGGSQTLRGIWGIDATMFAVGDSGAIFHSSNGGGTWTAAASLSPAYSGSFYRVWGSDTNNVFAVGDNVTIYRSTDGGATWNLSNTGCVNTSNPTTTFQGLWGSGSNDIYVVGGPGTIYHSTDGANWTHQNGAAYSLSTVWGSSATDVYATGGYELLSTVNHGTNWTSPAGQIGAYAGKSSGVGPGTLYLLYGAPGADVYYVTNSGATLTRLSNTGLASNSPVVDIWASSPVDVYVVGQGLIEHGQL